MFDSNYDLKDEGETLRLAENMASHLRPGMNLYLKGELGAGKTTFVRGLLRGLSYQDKVKSPTYTLVEPYNFDKFKLYLQYVNRKATNILDTQNYSSRSAQQIGARSFLTTAIEGWANIGYGKNTSYDKNYNSANFTAWQLGLNYYLSKRTNLYTIYGSETEYTAAKALAAGIRVVF